MSSSSPAPKIPFWAFILTDIVLVGAAALIAARGPQPWSEVKIFAVAACVCVGALLLLVPWLVHVERERNELLDERQRALESLARTVTSSAEQISIAASGLHEITDIAQKNLKHAELLPHKLQEKIAEFQAQLANANDTEREELEKELEELRGSESERLQTIADRITRTTAEFAKLETATHQHLVAANEALTKLSMGTASAIGKAQAAAEQALAQARQEASRNVGDAVGHGVKSIEAAKAAATSEVHALFEKNIAQLKAAGADVAALIEKLQAAAANAASQPATPIAAPSNPSTISEIMPHSAPTPELAPATQPKDEPAGLGDHPGSSSPSTVPPASPPKRPRKQRREEPSSTESSTPGLAPVPDSPTPSSTAPENASEPTAPAAEIATPAAPEEPAPVLPGKIAEIAPVAPHTMEPFVPREQTAPTPIAESSSAATETPPEPTKPPRKRAAKKADEDQPALGLDIEPIKENGEAGPGVVERVLSSDGATRLIVTAYIGIGNRLFIRGSGPGLSWEKGMPLQFVSIGKWRWETNDASAPVEFKLLKNDEQESAGLGTLTIDPGHQHEVTANFS